ncbi:hypothetical protein DPMN_112020 [Dreissena polymorpha]|uniref:Uncharacterized protein n=1 Tax=Dreissena polymorpha TaxID=45954 RepID=A0A9D4KFB6_DREPO|nr:hypothetical protein DPMN_112020 [Dreissena polymorpha]
MQVAESLSPALVMDLQKKENQSARRLRSEKLTFPDKQSASTKAVKQPSNLGTS